MLSFMTKCRLYLNIFLLSLAFKLILSNWDLKEKRKKKIWSNIGFNLMICGNFGGFEIC